ncbi:MAG: maltose alpha-D-glucosyltransferase [Pirellulales bacterium]|nr:maltose alpha-D-glucosyltransferase [Pirellulales bacterium]
MSETDLQWYKDAIIYQLHVRSFCDWSGDGVGDFRGLAQKLDYLQDLGATAIWLLPFYPSPLKDDGYDIADYQNVHPSYGTLPDFKAFLRAAHDRGLKVITELVINHTSDQHPWFQRARRAKPGSRHRNYYVWSDTPEKYREARIIFKDFETSNWTWDPVAQAYYWHRFYGHQPDLNFDSPDVRKAIFQILDHWLALGVDGLRLDAVPYLFEREGTNCENLPETHAFLREIRAYVDAHYPGRMLLAEANQWPEDAGAYFGAGDECHTAFHFPVMPRMFMGVQMEDRFPIIDIMQQTPEIPDACQWMLFLRNHDELTLEMVTDEERDYMYRVYAHNPQARINLGIRRRLAPLLGNHRRKIELLNSLLMSLPGTPVIYYGDEIGMGDNIYLGDRNGVRTPMQWSPDRNAGFSTANPQQLYLPLIIDHEYHYEALNVETARRNPYSLFWWMKRLIAMRQQSQVFSRGSLKFLLPENPRVLAYIRTHQDQSLLAVANLSRFSQFVELDLAEYRGCTPLEQFGQTVFPRIGDLPYLLTLGPHSFYWFSLQPPVEQPMAVPAAAPAAGAPPAVPQLNVTHAWDRLFTGQSKRGLEKILPRVLTARRWFGGKAKPLRAVYLHEVIPLEGNADGQEAALALLRVEYVDEEPEIYVLPLAFTTGAAAEQMLNDPSPALVARLQVAAGGKTEEGVLYDPLGEEAFSRMLLDAIASRRRFSGGKGKLIAHPGRAFRRLRGAAEEVLPARLLKTEQSNSTVVYGDRLLLKLFRRLEEGVNPELELGGLLTNAAFPHVSPVAGSLDYRGQDGSCSTVAILQGFVRNEGDAWNFTLDSVGRFFERVLTKLRTTPPEGQELPRKSLVQLVDQPVPPLAQDLCNAYLEAAALLGQRTAELHHALAHPPNAAELAPEPFTELYQRSLYQALRGLARRTFRLLRSRMKDLPEEMREEARAVLLVEQEVVDRFHTVVGRKVTGARIRCHGDYHLGQVLYTGKDFVIIDFEGEPAYKISERRIKRSPIRDVAGMIRSFEYAAKTVLLNRISGMILKEELPIFRQWAEFWSLWVGVRFLKAYLGVLEGAAFMPQSREEVQILLDVFLLEKAVYELGYELNNRPAWIRVPIQGILHILESLETGEKP